MAVRIEFRGVLTHALGGVLGGVHGDVGVLEELVHGRAVVRGHRDADAGVHHHRDGSQVDRQVERRVHLLGASSHRLAAGDVADEDGELVAAEPRQHVAGAHEARQSGGDLLQQAVTVLVAERVVDLLEVVEVYQHEGGQAVLAE